MRNSASDTLDLTNLSAALQTATAAAEQFAARVAQNIGFSPSTAKQANLAAPSANAAGLTQLLANLFGRGGGQPLAPLQQMIGQFTKTVQQAAQAAGAQGNAAVAQIGKLNDGANQMAAAVKRGNAGLVEFAGFVARAGGAVNGFANNLAKAGQAQVQQLFHARGMLTPQEQQQQAAAQTQVQKQMQQFLSQLSNQVGQSLQGGDQIQQMVDAAKAAGDPQQAIDIARSYVMAQLNQSMINAQNLANGVDPIMHSFGAPGQLAPQGNLQYLLSQPGQLTDTIHMLQSMLDNLDKMQANLANAPHLASGGVVTDPTMALVGESGPEAIIPLSRLQSLLGNPANFFPWLRGGNTIAPEWLTGGQLANFDRAFDQSSQLLNRQLDLGNAGAAAMLARWNQVQDSAMSALDFVSQHRQIDLGAGASGLPGQQLAASSAAQSLAGALHFNFGDIHVAGRMTTAEIGSLFDRIEQEANSRGYDITGRAALRRPPQSVRGPLTPAGYAR